MNDKLIESVKVITKENDIFNTYGKAMAIVNFLKLNENQKLLSENNLIAIYGSWGSGKSSLMKTIENNLDHECFEALWYDTWKYEADENMPYSLLKYILKNNRWEQFKEKGERFLDDIYDLFKGFTKGTEVNLGIITLKPGEVLETIRQDQSKIHELTIWEKYQEFETAFSKVTFNGHKLIVFLDDLDRCDSKNIISLISSIKLLLSINKNIIFIIGIDRDAVSKALSNKYNNDYNKAEEYLEKIFPLNFSITPQINHENIIPILSEILSFDINDAKIILNFFNKIQFNNPRHIKKLIRKYCFSKHYLKSADINVNNISVVIIILYFIILNNFYPYEYKYMGKEAKLNIYREISLVSYDNKTGRKIESPFLNYKIACYLNYESGQTINIFPILLFFSSYKLQKKEINCLKFMSREGKIEFSNWQILFEDSICSRFIDFILSDPVYYEFFVKDNEVQLDLVEDLFIKINNVM